MPYTTLGNITFIIVFIGIIFVIFFIISNISDKFLDTLINKDKKYSRPYCENCKLIWDSQSIDRILICTKCGRPLTLKSFNPWFSLIGGLCIIFIGGLTLVFQVIPIIWIGGFLFGASLIVNSFRQWLKITKLDKGIAVKRKDDFLKDDAKYLVITCGKCNQKIRVHKGKGIIKIKCPKCTSEYKIMT